MTRAVEGVRLVGLAVPWLGAWFHWIWLMTLGAAFVVAAWLQGILRHPRVPPEREVYPPQ